MYAKLMGYAVNTYPAGNSRTISTRPARKLHQPACLTSDQQQINIKKATKLAKESSYGKDAEALRFLSILPSNSDDTDDLIYENPQEGLQGQL